MGLFNGYMKEGKGVDKDAPKPIRPVYFFELFFRKFGKMIQLNLLFILTSVPFWIVIYMLGNFLISDVGSSVNDFTKTLTTLSQVVLNPLSMVILLALCFLLGPSTAGATYILINYSTEMPVFLCSDYFEHFRKNFKQASILMMINMVATVSTFITWILPLIPGYAQSSNVNMLYILRFPSLIVLILFNFMNFYAYSIMVLFKMKLKDILKNSLLFALGRLPWNVLILAIVGILCYAAFTNFAIGMIVMILLLYSLCGFIVVFGVYPTIEKFMLIPAKEKENTEDPSKEIYM